QDEGSEARGDARQDLGDAGGGVLRAVGQRTRRHALLRGARALGDGAAPEAHEGALGVDETARLGNEAELLVELREAERKAVVAVFRARALVGGNEALGEALLVERRRLDDDGLRVPAEYRDADVRTLGEHA